MPNSNEFGIVFVYMYKRIFYQNNKIKKSKKYFGNSKNSIIFVFGKQNQGGFAIGLTTKVFVMEKKLKSTTQCVFVVTWIHEWDGSDETDVYVCDSLAAARKCKDEIIDDINEFEDGYFRGFKENCFDNWSKIDEPNRFYIHDLNAEENSEYIAIQKKYIQTLTK